MGIIITQEVELDISLDDLLDQTSPGELLDGLESSIGLHEILDHFGYDEALDAMKNTRGLDNILDHFPTRNIVKELVESYGVQKVQDLLNEHHESEMQYASLAQKLEGVSLEDLAGHLVKKHSMSTLLATLAIAVEESFQGKEV